MVNAGKPNPTVVCEQLWVNVQFNGVTMRLYQEVKSFTFSNTQSSLAAVKVGSFQWCDGNSLCHNSSNVQQLLSSPFVPLLDYFITAQTKLNKRQLHQILYAGKCFPALPWHNLGLNNTVQYIIAACLCVMCTWSMSLRTRVVFFLKKPHNETLPVGFGSTAGNS